jgi:hypothetical protein
MATWRPTLLGFELEFDNSETTLIINALQSGSSVSGIIASYLATAGIHSHSTVAAVVISTVFSKGATALTRCNSRHRGIKLVIFWVGVPSCVGL